MRMTPRTLLLLISIGTGVSQAQETAVVLKQSAPLTVASYQVAYEPDRSSSSQSRSIFDQIKHTVRLQNNGDKDVLATQVGLVHQPVSFGT